MPVPTNQSTKNSTTAPNTQSTVENAGMNSAEAFDDGGVCETAALTHRLEAVAAPRALQLVEQRRHESCARAPERVTESNRTTVGIHLVHVRVENIDSEGRVIGSQSDGLEGDVADELLLLRRPVVLGGGSGFMFRRNVLDRVGHFDPEMSTSADWDLCYRVAAVSRVAYIDEPLLRYRYHGSNMHSNIRVMEHDMLLGYKKAFANGSMAGIRRRSLSQFYLVLAGSYFHAAQYLDSFRAAVVCFAYSPRTFLARSFRGFQ